jgi:hypothetical protein
MLGAISIAFDQKGERMLRSQVRRSNATIQMAICTRKHKSKNDKITKCKQAERQSKMEKSKTLASK